MAQDRSNGTALGFGVNALAALGEAKRAQDWIRRALLIDPENLVMRYNLACALSTYLRDVDGALDLLDVFFAKTTKAMLEHAKIDCDLNPIREDPRFKAMISATEERLAAEQPGPTSTS